MSTTQPVGRTSAAPPLRVRDQAREAVTLVACSAAMASCLALALLVLDVAVLALLPQAARARAATAAAASTVNFLVTTDSSSNVG